jgi:ribosomal protein S18 acetylase RimI-like enzyme
MQTATDYYAENRHASAVTDRWVATAWPKDKARLADVLTMAFADDPAARWLYPDDDRYRHDFADFVRAFGGNSVELGTAYQVGDDVACALWLPPGEESDEESVVDHVLRRIAPQRHDEVFAVFEAMGRAHPTEPHWYLPLIGVEPAFQGYGYGSALLRHVLKDCDREGIPAYLEATSAQNIALYERHGFQRLEAVEVGTCPAITPMWRVPLGSR